MVLGGMKAAFAAKVGVQPVEPQFF